MKQRTSPEPTLKRLTAGGVRFLTLLLLSLGIVWLGLFFRSFFSAVEMIGAIYDLDYPRVRTALAWGADANGSKPWDGFTPLMRAVSAPMPEEHRNFVPLLIAYGADVNQRDVHGRTALDWAYDLETIRLLKRYGAKE
jgi:hypothetical protein